MEEYSFTPTFAGLPGGPDVRKAPACIMSPQTQIAFPNKGIPD
jgi:hypothetical protein